MFFKKLKKKRQEKKKPRKEKEKTVYAPDWLKYSILNLTSCCYLSYYILPKSYLI